MRTHTHTRTHRASASVMMYRSRKVASTSVSESERSDCRCVGSRMSDVCLPQCLMSLSQSGRIVLSRNWAAYIMGMCLCVCCVRHCVRHCDCACVWNDWLTDLILVVVVSSRSSGRHLELSLDFGLIICGLIDRLNWEYVWIMTSIPLISSSSPSLVHLIFFPFFSFSLFSLFSLSRSFGLALVFLSFFLFLFLFDFAVSDWIGSERRAEEKKLPNRAFFVERQVSKPQTKKLPSWLHNQIMHWIVC